MSAKSSKNTLLQSLLRQWRTRSAFVQELLAGRADNESGFDLARLREAIDQRTEVEDAIRSFWLDNGS